MFCTYPREEEKLCVAIKKVQYIQMSRGHKVYSLFKKLKEINILYVSVGIELGD